MTVEGGEEGFEEQKRKWSSRGAVNELCAAKRKAMSDNEMAI